MKEVFIISTGQIVNGRLAGAQRVANISKSLAAGGVKVWLCSLPQIKSLAVEAVEISPGISYLKSTDSKGTARNHTLNFMRSVNRFINDRKSEAVIYIYPTTFVFKDLIYLLYFKIPNKHKVYCDINELRATNVFSLTPPRGILMKMQFYLKGIFYYTFYKLSELLIPGYDGIVVISKNLEKYFSKLAKKTIRIPILCDVTEITVSKRAVQFDGGVFRICFAGLINCTKEGFDILFEALSILNKKAKVELYLYGSLSDEDRDAMELLKKKHRLPDMVFYMGILDPDKLLTEFLKYHLLILPRPSNSQAKFGFSTKLSEYLISGVPVLVTDVSDNALYIKDNYNGFIIPPGSSTSMVSKILGIMEAYNSNSSAIAEKAFKTAVEEFDYRLYTKALIDFFYHGKLLLLTAVTSSNLFLL